MSATGSPDENGSPESGGSATCWTPFASSALPLGEEIARGEPIGPFHSYSNEDHWVDRPVAPGVVLIGDAAGHNDPITGQGTLITLRDARIVQEIIRDGDRRPSAFEPYIEERRERMRRLRITTRFATTLRVEFGPAAARRDGQCAASSWTIGRRRWGSTGGTGSTACRGNRTADDRCPFGRQLSA
jgi:2-polyprenyl-6-methoxyphenol hydroxylase-like FAD-dependent oxidoreductase